MKNFALGFLLATLLAGAGYWLTPKKGSENSAQITRPMVKYHCPMHPQFISDKPGICPICSMNFVPTTEETTHLQSEARPPVEAKTEPKALYYVDSMNPQYRSNKPGKAPDGMDLVPVYSAEPSPPSGATVSGYVPVKISLDRQQAMGIIVDEAKLMSLEDTIHTVGRVTVDETRIHHIHTKFDGFIEHLFVDFVGEFVKKGDPLFSIYSPELLATQKEFLLALRAKEELVKSGSDNSFAGIDLVEAARQRLSLWDIDPGEIAQLERTRQTIRAVTIYSPSTGFVSAKMATHGTRVGPADAIYDLVDLSSIWVLADLYEADFPFVAIGQSAEMTLPYQPGRTWRGRVTYINPTLDEKTRTGKARLEFSNLGNLLKPEMYVDITLKRKLGRTLAVPESAVMTTGERTIVFVAKGNDLFEPREVTTGAKIRNYYEVKKGVKAGERVVTGANFLLDSESKLRAALSGAESH
jgi:RND family efflux transporter MFP subunit